jgi:hypothetical protein
VEQLIQSGVDAFNSSKQMRMTGRVTNECPAITIRPGSDFLSNRKETAAALQGAISGGIFFVEKRVRSMKPDKIPPPPATFLSAKRL